ncbi:hypothetical protein D0469_08205 [Peribacillus saganii]|uniref:Uncharacterized protein n=1 Tax=Peribacillus saganii TaxID=2303992 RepID=A0A372LPV6_9BACI|nr:hypothetical protein [Peribacillus saganii]RFU70154.1 hypothetical protein D0469_08205 [Peribacillus saganii]
MVRMKAVACSSIFLLLFTGAWIMNEGNKREYIIFNYRSDSLPGSSFSEPFIIPVQEGELDISKQWNFKSREYIQIRKTDHSM